jgi:small subunit ribosomal protein S2
MSALPSFTMRQLIEAGVHFGHNTRRWNPKMAPYLFGVRNGIHIIDLQQTVPALHRGIQAIRDVVAAGGRVLFVGTKRAAAEIVAESAKRCGQYYVNHRWLGGMLTNWKTISLSIKRLREIEERVASGNVQGLTKKEQLNLAREQEKLERALGGIKEMGGLPDIIWPFRKPTSWAFRWWRSSIPIRIRPASITRSRAMTMRCAPSRPIAT